MTTKLIELIYDFPQRINSIGKYRKLFMQNITGTLAKSTSILFVNLFYMLITMDKKKKKKN